MQTRTELNTIEQAIKQLRRMPGHMLAAEATPALQSLGILNPAERWMGTWENLGRAVTEEVWDREMGEPQEWVMVALKELRASSQIGNDPAAMMLAICRLAGVRLFFRKAAMSGDQTD